MLKKSVIIAGRHYTSITIEEAFWQELLTLAAAQNISPNRLITQIDATRGSKISLSSAIRLFVLEQLKERSRKP